MSKSSFLTWLSHLEPLPQYREASFAENKNTGRDTIFSFVSMDWKVVSFLERSDHSSILTPGRSGQGPCDGLDSSGRRDIVIQVNIGTELNLDRVRCGLYLKMVEHIVRGVHQQGIVL